MYNKLNQYRLRRTGFVFIGLMILLSCKHNIKTVQYPNLVIVFPDQMRGQAMGFTGDEPVITPRLDQFSRESIVFEQAVSTYPLCSPFRAMLMTGKYPLSNHVTTNSTSNSAVYGCELSKSDTTWSDILHNKGYSLGYIGKWHLESPYEPYIDCANNEGELKWNEWTPPDRRHGFDYWYAYNTYDYHMKPMYWSKNAGRNEFHYVDQWGPEHEADMAVKYIKNEGGKYRKKKNPFALVVSMNPPHMPYDQVPQKYKNMYKDADTNLLFNRPDIPLAGTKWGNYYRKNIRNYYAMISGVDEQFGRILDALKDEGLEKNTIVLFTSDHGNCLGIHDRISKSNPYEESVRIPFIIRWNNKLTPRYDDMLISTPDIFPTLMQLMGFAKTIPSGVQGTGYGEYFLTGEGPVPESQLYYIILKGLGNTGSRGVRTSRYSLVINRFNNTPDTILFDRQIDPYQFINIAAENPQIVNKLIQTELKPWLIRINDPFCDK